KNLQLVGDSILFHCRSSVTSKTRIFRTKAHKGYLPNGRDAILEDFLRETVSYIRYTRKKQRKRPCSHPVCLESN
ncbi:hypothetical protein X975_00241, partial [Stegodyphus mimosarum]